MTGPAAPEGHHPNPSGPFSYAGIVFDAWLRHVVTYCGKNKAKVYYEARRSVPPAIASLDSFTLKFSELGTFSSPKKWLPLARGSRPFPGPVQDSSWLHRFTDTEKKAYPPLGKTRYLRRTRPRAVPWHRSVALIFSGAQYYYPARFLTKRPQLKPPAPMKITHKMAKMTQRIM